MKRNFYIFLFIIGIIASVLSSVNAQWEGWDYRRTVTIDNTSGSALTDYQVKIDLSNLTDPFIFGNANSDGSDIRITASDDTTELFFWIEEWSPPLRATIWVKVPSIPTPGGAIVYLYYGNTVATSVSDGYNTFNAYDGFETYTLGTVPISNDGNPGEWERYPGNPILVPGVSGWDAQGATFASVIYDDRVGEYRMYYHGYNTSHQVGLATSSDGINWTKYSGNPIVAVGSSGSWDRTGVRVPMVWKEGTNDYRMIYTGSGAAAGQIGYATSADGINWAKYAGNPVFNDPSWAHNQTENWGVMKVGSEYLMWYSTWGVRQSGIAVSTDLINWTPHTPGPIFETNGIPGDDRYSQFCPFSFKYDDDYYVLVPSYSSVGDYSKFYLYRSSSPYFPESDRTLVRIAHTAQGVDAKDNDTPFVLTLDIERSIFPNDELKVYYAADPGTGSWTWSECLMIEPDIAEALSYAPLPSAGKLTWTSAGTVAVVDNPVRQGTKSVGFTNFASLTGSFASLPEGVVGSWLYRTSTSNGDVDIYLYGGASLSCVAGLGRNGTFHYWNGLFQETATSWAIDTWYFVTLQFNCDTDLYDFVVYDSDYNEIVNVSDIIFGNASSSITRGMLYTSSGYTGTAFADDYRVRKWAGVDPLATVGDEEANPLPVELSSFSGSVIGSSVKLSWQTETEVNNYGFDIERKDGGRFSNTLNWKKIGFVNGNGNSNSPKDYLFEDKTVTAGKYSYRLKQIDNDGQFEYSKAIEIDFGVPGTYELSQNNPNPFNPTTRIVYQIPEKGKVTLKVFDMLGKEIATLVEEYRDEGRYEVEFNASDFSSGAYFYRIQAGDFVETKKMILMK